MAEIGKIISGEEIADVIFSIDAENFFVEIAILDAQGNRMLSSFSLGDTFKLKKGDGNILNLSVNRLDISDKTACRAVIHSK